VIKVLTLALPFFGLIMLGYVSGRIRRLPESGLAWMNFFIMYIALPVLFFQLISRTPVEDLTNYSFVFTTALGTYTAFALAFTLAILLNRGKIAEATIQGMIGGYANVGYMGPPLSIAVFGTAAATPAALIFCFDVGLVFILAPLLMAFAGVNRRPLLISMFEVVWRIISHPFIIATVAGGVAAYYQFRPPEVIDRLLDMLMATAAPAALFVMGVTVAVRPLKRVPYEIAPLLLIKLLIHPLIAWWLLTFVGGFEPVWIYTAVLMASLPPAATIFVMAQQYDVYVERASSAIMIGTAASIVSVTVVLYYITNGFLPIP
jgi:hypothetical protein